VVPTGIPIVYKFDMDANGKLKSSRREFNQPNPHEREILGEAEEW
jgi:hypothetical protein